MEQKYGRANDKTPAEWSKGYVDYSGAPTTNDVKSEAKKELTDIKPESKEETAMPVNIQPASATNAAATNGTTKQESPEPDTKPGKDINGGVTMTEDGEKEPKKRRRHEGETAEEKAERKMKKKAKHVKREHKEVVEIL